jgi:hypothetical protein
MMLSGATSGLNARISRRTIDSRGWTRSSV